MIQPTSRLKGECMSKKRGLLTKTARWHLHLKTNVKKQIEQELIEWTNEEVQKSSLIYSRHNYPWEVSGIFKIS